MVLNSEWEEVQLAMKKYLGLPTQAIQHKIAEIEKGSNDDVPYMLSCMRIFSLISFSLCTHAKWTMTCVDNL